MTENEIGRIIVHSAFKVHKNLGPGLLESAYQASFNYELNQSKSLSDLSIESEVLLPVIYREVTLHCGYRIDFWINQKVIIEIKAVDQLNDIHMAQLLTYLKLTKNKLGFLINFNVTKIKNGIRRVANNL